MIRKDCLLLRNILCRKMDVYTSELTFEKRYGGIIMRKFSTIPDDGWPSGNYEVRFFIDDTASDILAFSVN